MGKSPIDPFEPLVGSLIPSKKKQYKFMVRLKECKKELYAIVFNFIDSRYYNVFATAGGNKVSFSLSDWFPRNV